MMAMSYQPQWIRELAALALPMLLTVAMGSGEFAFAITGNLPATPPPCAADGVCHPNRMTWGVYGTRWRPWPGEKVGIEPTLSGDATDESGEVILPPKVLPSPIDEDLRGQRPKPKAKSSSGTEILPEQAPGEEEPNLIDALPDFEQPALPAFDPQGKRAPNPHGEMPPDDAPPALPESLRLTRQSLQSAGLRSLPPVASPTPSSGVVRTVWQADAPIRLVNPAATAVVGDRPQMSSQAVYYEASDK
jgi:hypothetical protein